MSNPAATGYAADPPPEELRLRRALGLPALVLFGLVYLVPLTVFTTYGIVTEMTGGRVALAYICTLAAMIVTAFSYAWMVRAYPVSGSAYTYTQRTFGGHAGLLAGWALMLDYFFLPMINYLVIGIFLNAQWPAIPIWVWIIAGVVIVTVLNLVGITTIARANVVIIAIQTIFIVVFVALAITQISGSGVSLTAPFTGDGSLTGFGPVAAGAAVLCLSFLGFDAVSTMVEEAKEPTRDVPRAIVLVTAMGGLIFIILSSLAQLVNPATTFADADSAALEVMAELTSWMGVFFTAAYVAGAFGSALTSQASVTRIMYVMGRDGVLPRPLARLAPSWRTPFISILVVSLVSLLAVVISLEQLSSLISFGALTAFSAVNLAVIKHYAIDRRAIHGLDALRYLIAPLVGFGLTVWLWTSLSEHTLLVGLGWLAIGFVWLLVLTRGFRRPPPELDLAET